MNDDELVAYLAGEPTAPVAPAERVELDRVRGLLADPAVWAEPEPTLEERVVAAIVGEQSAVDEAAQDQQRTATAAHRADVVPLRSRRLRYTVLGAAAAAVVTIALVFGLALRDDQAAEYAATLTGTELAPGASGDVTMTRTTSGWEIHLQAEGLPRRDEGAYYEAWLKNEDGQLVAIGTFNEGEDVTLWSGVGPTTHPTITVTRQLANGDPASSGEVVLTGTAEEKG
jgi:hypothetical protein